MAIPRCTAGRAPTVSSQRRTLPNSPTFSGIIDWNGPHAASTHGYVAMSAIE